MASNNRTPKSVLSALAGTKSKKPLLKRVFNRA